MKKNNKIKLTVSTLILTLGLSGCSFNLIKNDNSEKSISIRNEYDTETEMSDFDVDRIMFFPDEDEEFKEVKDYNYLIERTKYTEATLAHVISEKTITSEDKLFDGKNEFNESFYEYPVIQPMTLPAKYPLFGIESLSGLIECYGKCDITGKKLITLNGETLYCFDSVFTFNSMSERLEFGFEEGDTIQASTMYRLNELGQWELLYKKQTGKDYDAPNVLEANFNSDQDILVPIEDTVFADLIGEECSIEFINEALDVYNGTDNYYNEVNEGKDFTQYIKY